MKKLFLSIVMAVAAFTAQAQVYVGGEAGFWRDYDANNTTFRILPEIGYNLDEKWAIGTTIGYVHLYDGTKSHKGDGVKINAFEIAPYVRYTYAKLGPVNLFLDGGFGFATYKAKDGYINEDGKIVKGAQNAWEIGIKPGLSVNLTDKLSFVSHVGFLGYRDQDEAKVFGDNGLGFDLSGNALTFGLYYNF